MSWCSVCSFLIVVCLPFSCAAENRGNGLNGLVLNGTSGVGQTATDDKRDESFGYSDLSVDTQPQQHHPHHHQHHVSNKKNKHYRSSFFNGKAKSSKKCKSVIFLKFWVQILFGLWRGAERCPTRPVLIPIKHGS